MHHRFHTRRLIRAALHRTRKKFRRLAAWWREHRRRISEEIGYAEAFGAVLLAAADLIGGSYRAKYAVHQLVRAYLALQRIFSPPLADPDWTVAT